MTEKLPTEEERQELASLYALAFVELRHLAREGKSAQAEALADAFHSMPTEAYGRGRWSLTSSEAMLRSYEEAFPDGIRYRSMFRAIFYGVGAAVEGFLARHASTRFPPLLTAQRGLANGDWSAQRPSHPQSAAALHDIYSARGVTLARHQGAGAIALRDEVLNLCKRLVGLADAHCHIWSFSGPHGEVVVAIEQVSSEALLGCLSSLDRRRASAAAWAAFWGEEPPQSDL